MKSQRKYKIITDYYNKFWTFKQRYCSKSLLLPDLNTIQNGKTTNQWNDQENNPCIWILKL